MHDLSVRAKSSDRTLVKLVTKLAGAGAATLSMLRRCRCEPPLRSPSLPLVLPTVVEACIDDSVTGFADVRAASSMQLLSALPASHDHELKRLGRRVQLLVGSSVAIPAEVTPLPQWATADGTAVVVLLLAGGTEDERWHQQQTHPVLLNITHPTLAAVAEFGRRHCDGGDGRGAELSYTLMSRASFVFAGSPSVAGVHSALATLEQLVKPPRKPCGRSRPLPPIFVADQPAYGWRGFHLDVARHFFKVPTVEALVRRLARLKFNVLHLHLTDDQGWRLHVPSRPRLTSVGAYRYHVKRGRRRRYGGFFSAADVARLVSYCEVHGVRVVPEVDVPGHTGAVSAVRT